MSKMNSNNKSAKSGSRPGPGKNQVQMLTKKSQSASRKNIKINSSSFSPTLQKPSPKSMTGAFYNDGFDCVNRPTKPKIRRESFDEISIGALNGSVAFATTALALNPGQSSVFPRLSKFAVLYERYKFERLEFYFQHDVSQFNAQGAAGLVVLSALYDAASANPTTKAQVESTDPHVICMPNQNSLLILDSTRLHPQGLPFFVRPGNVPGGADIKTYDAGNCFVTTQGMAGATEVGEIHCRGVVAFYDEILDSSLIAAPVNNQVSDLVSSAPESLVTATPLQLLLATSISNGLNAVNTAGSIVLPAGNYMLFFEGAFVFGGSGTSASIQLQKNGANVGSAQVCNFVALQITSVSTAASRFVQSNGTDAFTLIAQATFSTSTCTCSGIMNFLAV